LLSGKSVNRKNRNVNCRKRKNVSKWRNEWRNKRHDGKQKGRGVIDLKLRTRVSLLGPEQDETALQTDAAHTEQTMKDEAGALVDVTCRLLRLLRGIVNANESEKEVGSVPHLDHICPHLGLTQVSATEKGKGIETGNIDHFLLDHPVLFLLLYDGTIPGRDHVPPRPLVPHRAPRLHRSANAQLL
jgi:hypothetical protein